MPWFLYFQCADKFYALKCFCKGMFILLHFYQCVRISNGNFWWDNSVLYLFTVRLLENNKIFLWGPLFPLLLSREYWINVIHGPYEPKVSTFLPQFVVFFGDRFFSDVGLNGSMHWANHKKIKILIRSIYIFFISLCI